jgi:hypothetical protein
MVARARYVLYTLRSPQATWPVNDTSGGSGVICSIAGTDGMILQPLGEFLRMYVNGLLTNYPNAKSIGDEFAREMRKTLEYHQTLSWNSVLKTYRWPSNCTQLSGTHLVNSFPRLPYNLIATIARAHWSLFVFDNDPWQLQIAAQIATDLKSNFITSPSGGLYWRYWVFSPDPFPAGISDQPEDLSHGIIVSDFIQMMAESGVVFKYDDLAKLNIQVKAHIITSTRIRGYIGDREDIEYYCTSLSLPSVNTTDYYDCRPLAFWLRHTWNLETDSNTTWRDRIDATFHSDSGNYGILATVVKTLTTRLTLNGSACTRDSQVELLYFVAFFSPVLTPFI